MSLVSSILPLLLVGWAAEARVELVSVQSVFRHGDRAPSSPYPHDPHGLEHWPGGWSQLTRLGAEQTQDLGRFYRARYVERLAFLARDRLALDVHMRTTSKQRAVQSAHNVLLGLMGPKIDFTHLHAHHDHRADLLLKPNSVPCARYDRLLEAENARLFAHYDQLHRESFRALSAATGMRVSMANVDNVFDAIYREHVHGLQLPEWARESVLDPATGRSTSVLDLVVELKRVQRMAEFNSDAKAKLRTGFLMGQIVEFMRNSSRGLDQPKLMLYSSHDATLTSLMYSMGVSDHQLTPYAAAISFELYKDDPGTEQPTYYVQVLYRNETGTMDTIPLRVAGCDNAMCELGQFERVLKDKIVASEEEHTKICQV